MSGPDSIRGKPDPPWPTRRNPSSTVRFFMSTLSMFSHNHRRRANLHHVGSRPPRPLATLASQTVRGRRPLLRRRRGRDLRGRVPGRSRSLLLLDATPRTWIGPDAQLPTTAPRRRPVSSPAAPIPSTQTDNPEHLDEVAGFAEVAAIDTLGTLPLSVVTAAAHRTRGSTRSRRRDSTTVWNRGQEQWMSLSSTSRLVTVEDTGRLRPARPPRCHHRRDRTPPPASMTVVCAPGAVQWEPCGGRMQCGILNVPVDPPTRPAP